MTEIISTERVIELLTTNCNIKGVIGADDWERARPVTIQTFLKDIFDHCGGVVWMADMPEHETAEAGDVGECGTVLGNNSDIMPAGADPDEDAVEKAVVQVPDDIIEDVSPAAKKANPPSGKWEAYTDDIIKDAPPATKKGNQPFGKWEEYRGKALSNLECHKIAEEMLAEGYSYNKISLVIRKSPQTINNWQKKYGWIKPTGEQ